MIHAALLLLMLGPETSVTSFHHQPEAQHPKSSAIHNIAGRLPHLLKGGLKGSTQHLILERQDGVCDVSEAYTRFHCGREDCALGSLAAGRVAEGDWASVW